MWQTPPLNLHRDVIRSCVYLVEHNLLSNSPIWIQGTKRSLWHSRLQSHIYYTSYSCHVHSWNKEVQESKLQVCGVSAPWLHAAEAFPVTGSAFCSTSAPCSVILPRTAHYPPDLQATKKPLRSPRALRRVFTERPREEENKKHLSSFPLKTFM